MKDWRFGKGVEVEDNGFILDVCETGEFGIFNSFYDEKSIKKTVLDSYGGLKDLVVLNRGYDCLCGNTIVRNDDLIMYGKYFVE
jgi:hypothetical protein